MTISSQDISFSIIKRLRSGRTEHGVSIPCRGKFVISPHLSDWLWGNMQHMRRMQGAVFPEVEHPERHADTLLPSSPEIKDALLLSECTHFRIAMLS